MSRFRYESLPADMFPFVGGTRKTCPCCENWCTCDNCCRRRGVAYVGVLRPLGLSGVSKETEAGRTSARGRARTKEGRRSKQRLERHHSRPRRSTSLSSLSDADEDGREGDTDEEEEEKDDEDGEPTGDTPAEGQEDEDEDAPGPMDIDETIMEDSSKDVPSGDGEEQADNSTQTPPISADGDARSTPVNDERSSSTLGLGTDPASAGNEGEHCPEGDEQQAPVDEGQQAGSLPTPEPARASSEESAQNTSAEPTAQETPSEVPDITLDSMILTQHPPSPPTTTTALFIESTPVSDATTPPKTTNASPSEPAQVTRQHQKIGEGPSLSQRGLRSEPLSPVGAASSDDAAKQVPPRRKKGGVKSGVANFQFSQVDFDEWLSRPAHEQWKV
ncbi:hypothetical protein CYLTODRAFT_271177 [Cylindrobasidium torrendii FP15055 ss-10]|uniref:Uncharacterized protein n=1 Tax=Cylindrobasidium torrendii FP15055 ss-10 TaxID=1314674 RepID=A0A0D7BS54_9AGAR|nr:hypothetical protein CYLTODRAFT_271177 [Cylindrobasidium torrendii FP15055 ss-10]